MGAGVMLSAGTDGTYDANQASCTTKVTTYFGTSMACPAAAGAAALARQYFVDGFYPTGRAFKVHVGNCSNSPRQDAAHVPFLFEFLLAKRISVNP